MFPLHGLMVAVMSWNALCEVLGNATPLHANEAASGSIRGWLIALLVGFALCVVLLIGLLVFTKVTIRFLVWLISVTFYRIRVHGRENLPPGGALLVSNHVSWLDGLLMMLIHRRPVRMMVYAGNFRNRVMLHLAGLWEAILIDAGPKSIARALRTARESIKNGYYVGIFPEGGISRSGNVQTFKPGAMKIIKGTDAPIIPMYLDGLWGSIFSFERGRFFWKLPKRCPYPIDIYFGKPIYNAKDMHQIRRAVQELGAEAVGKRERQAERLQVSVIRALKKRKFRSKIADSAGADLTGGNVLTRALILRRLLRRHVLESNEKYVGVLIPPSTGGVLVNLALSFDRRVPVNLNYTVSSAVMNECIGQAGIKRVLTSRKVMEKMEFDLDAEIIYLDDLREKVSTIDKLVSAFQAFVLPGPMLAAQLGLSNIANDDEMTVIFTSGSTGTPKGVMLTQTNIRHNVDAVNTVVRLTPDDVIIGILPFFHSFGYTVTLWTVAAVNIKGIYHFNPLDARQIGKLSSKHGGTILLSTPTFLRSYMKRCSQEDFATLDTVVAGAERLPKELCDAFQEKFDVRPVEGYGTTELSPAGIGKCASKPHDQEPSNRCKGGDRGQATSGGHRQDC